jgi:hypothetical protein
VLDSCDLRDVVLGLGGVNEVEVAFLQPDVRERVNEAAERALSEGRIDLIVEPDESGGLSWRRR